MTTALAENTQRDTAALADVLADFIRRAVWDDENNLAEHLAAELGCTLDELRTVISPGETTAPVTARDMAIQCMDIGLRPRA